MYPSNKNHIMERRTIFVKQQLAKNKDLYLLICSD